jgi:hypothetical protein
MGKDKGLGFLYRCEANYSSSGNNVYYQEFAVLRLTPKGYWIFTGMWHGDVPTGEKWVSNESRKRYAHPTKEQALEAFIYRKKRYMSILQSRLARVDEVLWFAKSKLPDKHPDNPMNSKESNPRFKTSWNY